LTGHRATHCKFSSPVTRPTPFYYHATHGWFDRPIGGGVSIASPSRKPALACRAGPVSPSMGDRERTRPAV
ncbi:hypothetical protein, partial [Limnobacter sp.]|uniref:hypothetical protein n=1 Tax=Limnobacter sp. TaxID=2003368 RepID=UPI0025BCB506